MTERKNFLAKMKNNLLEKKSELTDFLGKISKEDIRRDGQVMDSADEAASNSINKLNSSLQERQVGEIRMVNEALSRIDRGEYGICIGCDKPISDKRLEYYPYAARCIACQEKLEE